MTGAFETVKTAIATRLSANFSTLPLLFDNDNKTPEVPFVYCSINISTSKQASFRKAGNTTLFRYYGYIELNNFTPIGQGEGLGLQYADTLANIFKGQTFSNIVCLAAQIYSGSNWPKNQGAGKFWITPMKIPFWFDFTD